MTPKVAASNMNPKFVDRNVNEIFSGGEMKWNEILQLAVCILTLLLHDKINPVSNGSIYLCHFEILQVINIKSHVKHKICMIKFPKNHNIGLTCP